MSLKPKSAAVWLAVPLLAMNMIACGDDEEVPPVTTPPSELCGNKVVDDGEMCDDGNKVDRDACTNLCVPAECGDGIVKTSPAASAEECDDGNRIDNDGCNNKCLGPECGNGVKELGEACDGGANCNDECVPTSCGDGAVQAPEECDDGNRNDRDACTSSCTKPVCGDGFVQSTEDCDEGAANSDRGACLKNCSEAECGDGKVQTGVEACDDGNNNDNDDCTNDCVPKTCGDGIRQGTEECDDGDLDDTDGCTTKCVSGACGDGIRQGDEACDDGDLDDTDECRNDCTVAECGDGVQSETEECDEGDDNGPAPARCSDECTLINCGNGEIDPGEECDDENEENNDACLNSCQWNSCGDGFANTDDVAAGNPNELEECDDKNSDNADACTEECKWNSCGDSFLYTKGYNDQYDSDEDGNEDENNPFPLEVCDDGNTSNSDSCIRRQTTFGAISGFTCAFNTCGDGQVYSTVTDTNNPFPVEDCDDADALSDATRNSDSCLDTCEWASCEDGFVYTTVTIPSNPNDEEECDDGNDRDTDACVSGCMVADCGDGFVQAGVESCDDDDASCSNTCVLDTCGDGAVDAGEQCDDGNTNDNDSCLGTCQWNSCGDNIRYMGVTNSSNPNPIEQCDDGNGLNRDDCLMSCEWNSCGDGDTYDLVSVYVDDPMLDTCRAGFFGQVCDVDLDRDGGGDGEGSDCVPGQPNPMDECSNPFSEGEECDAGIDPDENGSCTAECEYNECGDGLVYTSLTLSGNTNALEQCDDGVASATCTDECTPVACGDGIVSAEAGESCDPDAAPWDEDGGCTACVVDTCGNGDVDMFEECDDQNTNNTDGCTNDCFEARCGDGITQTGEECDDGNTVATDACTNACEDARCNDGIRRAGVEECDRGTPSATQNGVENDDGFTDTAGFCTNNCEVHCFESPARPWAAVYNDETCVFVAEADDGDAIFEDIDDGGDPDYMTFVEAENYCDSLGLDAHLVKIQGSNEAADAAKNAFVKNLIDAIDDELAPDGVHADYDIDLDNDAGTDEDYPYWIGLYDNHTTQMDPRGAWIWIGDETVVRGGNNGGSNSLWEPTEPNDGDNNQATAGQEDCGAIILEDNDAVGAATPGRWNDLPCSTRLRFICEFPLAQSP